MKLAAFRLSLVLIPVLTPALASAQHLVLLTHVKKALSSRVEQKSYLTFLAEAYGEPEPILTFRQLATAISDLKSQNAAFGASVEKSVTEIRNSNPPLKLLPSDSHPDGFLALGSLETELVPASSSIIADRGGIAGSRKNLTELPENIAVSYVLLQALIVNSKANDQVLRAAARLLLEPASDARQQSLSALMPKLLPGAGAPSDKAQP